MKYDFELVGKVGSMSLVDRENGDMNYNVIAKISRELRPGIIWVTSGAAEIGRLDYVKRTGHELCGCVEDAKADYAAQGQAILMAKYREFVPSQYSLRQILVEHQHFNNEDNRNNLRNMLLRCPAQNAIPIINYNDAVCCEEIRKLEIQNLLLHSENVAQCVDNDETASQIASLVKTRTLLILSVVDGIYANPQDSSTLVPKISGKDLYELLEHVDYYRTCCKGASRAGANGAGAKLEYIKQPLQNGTNVIIANAKYAVKDIMAGTVPRTFIGL